MIEWSAGVSVSPVCLSGSSQEFGAVGSVMSVSLYPHTSPLAQPTQSESFTVTTHHNTRVTQVSTSNTGWLSVHSSCGKRRELVTWIDLIGWRQTTIHYINNMFFLNKIPVFKNIIYCFFIIIIHKNICAAWYFCENCNLCMKVLITFKINIIVLFVD